MDEIFITDFAIVGEPGNVNSAGIKLKGGPKVTLNELSDLIENEKAKTAEPVPEIELEVSEETPEEPKEELSAEPEEGTVTLIPENTEEEAKELEVDEAVPVSEEEVIEEAVSEEPEVSPQEMESGLKKLAGMVDEIIAQNKALSEKVEELSQKIADGETKLAESEARLAAKEKEEQEFCEKFKNLYVSVGGERKETVKTTAIYTDGIGD